MIPLKIGFCIECGCNRPIANAHFSLCLMHNQIRLNAQKSQRSNKGNTANRIVEPVKGPRTPCKPRKPIRKRSEKKILEIRESNEYYAQAIAENIRKNGFLKCEECGCPIPINEKGNGSNVAHVVSDGRNKALYLHPKNRFVLCFPHVTQFDGPADGRRKMKIYPRRMQIRDEILNEDYTRQNP